MKKNLLLMGMVMLALCVASCSKDDDNDAETVETVDAADLDYTAENAAAWGNYAVQVAALLRTDAQTLYGKWNDSFAVLFKTHSDKSGYTSATSCVEEMLQGCIDIANEVGTAKIGEPYDLYVSGRTNEAVYAVESWYSWHSRDDYKNNVKSIANTLLGVCLGGGSLTSASVEQADARSIIYMCKNSSDPALADAAQTVWNDVVAAWKSIDNIPQPFRSNINSAEAATAMDRCAALVLSLEALQGRVAQFPESDCGVIVERFVDAVVMPTYRDLRDKTAALYDAVLALREHPSNGAFETACNAWLAARQPWETSEAFLFGPVAELGLDPNMDSWPLDQAGIANLIKSQKWSELSWTGDYDEDSQTIEAAQSLRGFHTLEFLLFKEGKPRCAQ